MSHSRGAVWFAAIPGVGDKPVVIVSWDVLNRALESVIVARITSVERDRGLPTFVSLDPDDVDGLPLGSFVICHDLFALPKPLRRFVGFVPTTRLLEIETALRRALDLDPA